MRGLAYRRHHRQRMLERAKRKLRDWGDDPVWIEQSALRWADNLAKCSCYMCGNPRRHFNELTFQEQRSKLNEKDEQ